jgi:GNAT superfamily N-acetyltransferase
MRWDFTVELHRVDEDREAFRGRFAAALSDFLASGRWTIWVAESGGGLVGTLWVERVDKVPRPYERPERWGYVTNVYVAPEHRNAGLGRRMLDVTVEEAKASNWELLLLWPSELSGAFYARAGFKPASDAVLLELGPAGGRDE